LAGPAGDLVLGQDGADQIAEALREAYGIQTVHVNRLPIGHGTRNYRATCADWSLFVKRYPSGTDLDAELAGIDLSLKAGAADVPVAEILSSASGALIAGHGDVYVSVWAYVDGRTVESGLSTRQLEQAGAALGLIHRRFRGLDARGRPAGQTARWMSFDLARKVEAIDSLLAVIGVGGSRDAFDEEAERTLSERRAVVDRVPALLRDLPPLTSQVLHGDYSSHNLMFSGDRLAAIVDFRPPDPFLVSYELGRIAFDPRTVLASDWLNAGLTLVRAYLAENPRAEAADIIFSARIALVQLMRSLYGVRNHYLEPGLLQADLDEFWLLRHRASLVILEQLDDVENALRVNRLG
jgi:Ser/Thr protein kinase RdoA (MazF antagonist)